MKLQIENIKKSYDNSESSNMLENTEFNVTQNLTDIQKSMINNLETYLKTRRLTASHGSLENTHQKIRIYLAETLLRIVTEKLKTYEYYYQQYLNLLTHYQHNDPMFFIDDDFENMVIKPMKKDVDKFQWDES